MTEPMRFANILIIKPSALGDVVHALPVLTALRRRFADAKITWMIRPEFAPLLDCVPGLDEKLLFNRKQLGRWYTPQGITAMKSLIGQLRAAKYDLILDFQGLLRTALLSWLSGSPTRVGMANAREGAPLFYTHRVTPPADSLHMVDRCRTLLEAIGVRDFDPHSPLAAPAKSVEYARGLLDEAKLAPGRFAVLIAGSAHPSKCWPTERFAAIAEKLVKQYGFKLAAVGTAGEKKIVSTIQQVCAVPIADFCGRTNIPQLVALLGLAGLVVANDTGPGHIAAALDVPTVLIFGPTNPGWVAPYGRPETVVAIEPEKRGTPVRSPDPKYRIENISVQHVLHAVAGQLDLRGGRR